MHTTLLGCSCAAVILALSAPAAAERTRDIEERVAQAMEKARSALDRADVLMLHGGGPREVVRNSPFTADVIYRTEQLLADGNRIVRTTESTFARDSQGRTRQQRGNQTVRIDDPVAKRSWLLHPDSKRAIGLPELPHEPFGTAPGMSGPDAAGDERNIEVRPGRIVVKRTGKGEPGDVRVEIVKVARDAGDAAALPEVHAGPGDAGLPALTLHGQPLNLNLARRGKGATEKLGTRDVEGVRAEGTRTTWTLPAGAIGNERPIITTSERWYSSELQAVVLATTSDPRAGQTTYRLANIRRAEPAPELFRVPPDYRER